MHNQNFQIVKYDNKYREQIIDVWEQSVLATHQFLKHTDFLSIKEFVKTIDFNTLEVYCLINNNNLIGFLGVDKKKIEMLFLSPENIGKGLGKKLMNFALSDLKINKVDVNEDNYRAVAFYQSFGFKVYERNDNDDQGKNYPILRMEL